MHPSTADAFVRAHAHRQVLGAVQPAIEAATMALLDGVDDERVTALAAMHAAETPSLADAVIAGAQEALGLELDAMAHEDAVVIVARTLLLEHLAGTRALHSITSWAHDVVGHDTAGPIEPLLQLEDELDLAGAGAHRSATGPIVDAVLAATVDAVSRWRPPPS